jgi:hypothetical protein
VYIEVRPEGLIVPGRVSVGTIGVVGTADRGPLRRPVFLGSLAAAREQFGRPDAWGSGGSDKLSLVRALELAYGHGANTVVAVRVGQRDDQGNDVAVAARRMLTSASGNCVDLAAATPGTWGDDLRVNVWTAEEDPFVEDESHLGAETPQVTLRRTPVVKSARTRMQLLVEATGVLTTLEVIYSDDPGVTTPGTKQVMIERTSGKLTFGTEPADADKLIASYVVSHTSAVKVTVQHVLGTTVAAEEVYTVVDGDDLAADVTRRPSALVQATAVPANADEKPSASPAQDAFAAFVGGNDGPDAANPEYSEGFEVLLNEDAHIMLAAGRSDDFGDDLDAHCQAASTDVVKRDRIGVVGSAPGADLDTIRGHTLNSDRIVFVAPGIKVGEDELPGAYAAAAVAGLLAGLSAHVSPTNKTLRVDGLQQRFDSASLIQLLNSRVLALEQRQGFRIVRGITTSTNTAWQQITTRRIVDYAKYGVRSASEPYIGLLNNERVRAALHVTVNAFLGGMVDDEMLVSYELTVGATRDEERQGIARVTIVLRPTFSIDFIKVTMFLE